MNKKLLLITLILGSSFLFGTGKSESTEVNETRDHALITYQFNGSPGGSISYKLRRIPFHSDGVTCYVIMGAVTGHVPNETLKSPQVSCLHH